MTGKRTVKKREPKDLVAYETQIFCGLSTRNFPPPYKNIDDL